MDDFERAEEEKKRARDQLWLEFEEAYGPPPERFAEIREWDADKYSAHKAANESLLGNFWDLQILHFGGANRAWLGFPDLVLIRKLRQSRFQELTKTIEILLALFRIGGMYIAIVN